LHRIYQSTELALRGWSELAQYYAPKLKAIEHSRAADKPYEQMTDAELEAIIRGAKPN
jgi:hypothetical protein